MGSNRSTNWASTTALSLIPTPNLFSIRLETSSSNSRLSIRRTPPPDLNRWEFGSREDQLIAVIILRWSLNFWRRERERERKMIEIVSRYFRQLLALLIFHPTSKYYKVLQHFWSLFRASIFCSLQSFIIFRPPSTPTLVAFIGVISTHGPRFAYSIQVYNINFTTKALSFCDIF